MKSIVLFLLTIGVGAIGCSGGPDLKQGPVSVSGKVSRAGLPVGDVMVNFQPLDNGHVGSFPVKPDGSFLGELIAGNYSYYVGKSTAQNSDAALKKIDPKFYEPHLDRSIAVEPGLELLIALD